MPRIRIKPKVNQLLVKKKKTEKRSRWYISCGQLWGYFFQLGEKKNKKKYMDLDVILFEEDGKK